MVITPLFSCTVLATYPIYDTEICFVPSGTLIEKLPSMSVTAPVLPSSNLMVAPVSGSWLLASTTLPFTMRFCANAERPDVVSSAASSNEKRPAVLFPLAWFMLKRLGNIICGFYFSRFVVYSYRRFETDRLVFTAAKLRFLIKIKRHKLDKWRNKTDKNLRKPS